MQAKGGSERHAILTHRNFENSWHMGLFYIQSLFIHSVIIKITE